MIRTKSKQESLSTLIKKADDVVSLFVRLSHADERGTVSCISCGCRLWYLDADCCHFMDRMHMGTRYDLENLAPGCQDCNRFNPAYHKTKWSEKLSVAELERLQSNARSLKKYMRHELEEMIEYFSEKIKQLKKEKGL